VVREHLDALAAHGIPMATGLAWPIFGSKPSATPWPGWCHGSAGYVFVWSLAARSYSEGHYVDLAIRSGEHCWSCLTASDGSLCCGRAGRALAMFELECLVPGHGWRKRADAMGGQALRERTDERIPHSLFKGGVGPSLVAAEILYAQEATLPFCHAAS
jgi:serine/threonine-protein kinase